MMKKYSKIMTLSIALVLTSCTSRKTETSKSLSKSDSITSQYQKLVSDRDSQINTLYTNALQSQMEKDSLSKAVSILRTENEGLKRQISEQKESEDNSKNSQYREYFENGKLKSESIVSEKYSKTLAKLELSAESWKNSAVNSREELNSIREKLSKSDKSNLDKSEKIKESETTISDLKSQVKKLESEKNKKTEKTGLPWYVIALISILAWELFKFFGKNLKQSQWYLKILELLTKKR